MGRSRETCEASSGETEPLWRLAEHKQIRFVVQITLRGYDVEDELVRGVSVEVARSLTS